MVLRTISGMSAQAVVVISPATSTSPVVVAVSQATRESGSCASSASSTPSLIWSQSLSGWPSVTLSLVKNAFGSVMKLLDIRSIPLAITRRTRRTPRRVTSWCLPPVCLAGDTRASPPARPFAIRPLLSQGLRGRGVRLSARLPRRQVVLLLRRERVNAHAHRLQLQPRDLVVNLGRDGVDLGL